MSRFKRSGLKIWAVRLAKALAILALTIAVMHGVLSFVWGRRYEREINRVRAMGDPISAAELAGEPVPDSENAAVVFQSIFRRLADKKLADGKEALAKVVEHDWALNALVKTPAREKNVSEKDWPAAVKAAPKFDWVAPRVEEALARPECKFAIDWTKGFDTDLSHYAKLREVSRILTAKSLVYARQGDTAEAVRWARLAQRTAECIKDDPLLIGMLVRAAMNVASTRAATGIVQQGGLTQAQAKELFDGYRDVDFTEQYVKALRRGERVFLLTFVEEMQAHGPRWAIDVVNGRFRAASEARSSFAGFLVRPWAYMEGTIAMRSLDRVVARTRIPYRDLSPTYDEDELARLPRYAVLNRMVTPVYGRVRATLDRDVARIAVTQGALALAAYHERFGDYPSALSDVRAKLGWTIPPDVLSGKPLVYRRIGKGYILYSIGMNLKDDGGRREITDDSSSDRNSKKPDDVVVGMDH